MKPETQAMLRDTLISFVRSVVEVPYNVEELKKAYPFHALVFPGEAIKAFKRQRSIVTKMGRQLIPRLAEIVARDLHVDVHRNHEIVGWIDVAKMEAIDRIVNELRMGRRKPNHQREIEEILAAKSDEKREVRVIADLFVGDFKPGPLPNLDVCTESKRKMLIFQALFEDRMPQAFLALYYNPHFPNPYRHSFTKRIMDLEQEVLIGGEMWDKLGGRGTYNELLSIIEEVERLIRG